MKNTFGKTTMQTKKERRTNMTEYTIRSMATGAIISRGWYADNEAEAEYDFLMENPQYTADEVYASESKWND